MAGSASDVALLLEAVARICEAERVALSELQAIHFLDDEISIHIRRSDGRCRINTYPVAVVRAAVRTAGSLPAVAPIPL